MKKISIAFVAVLSLAAVAGCKKKAASGDCASALDNAMKVSSDEMAKVPGITPAVIAKMKDVSVTRCKEDKWSGDVLKCMTDAKSSADVTACQDKMDTTQKEKMAKAISDAMGPAPGAGDTGSADPGSAAGSAGSAAMEGSAGSADLGSAAAGSADPAGSAAAGSGSAM